MRECVPRGRPTLRATGPSRIDAEQNGEDSEIDIAIRFSDKNDYGEISAKAASAKRKLKKIALTLLYRANSTAGKSLTHLIFSQDHS